jgi:hypothetical protein
MVATSCEAIQELLAEVSGDVGRLCEAESRHLDVCPRCCEAAAAERALGRILALVHPPEDPEMASRVLTAVRPLRFKRRVVELLPVAASLLLAFLGVMMVGGLPGGSLLALLPMWSSQGWISLAATLSDWGTVLTTTGRVTSALLSPAAIGTALVVCIAGVVAVATTARRWRWISPWRKDD